MPKFPVLKPYEVVRALQRAGFILHHQTGSHARLIHKTDATHKATIPMHNKDIPKGTLSNILRQSGFSVDEFLSLL